MGEYSQAAGDYSLNFIPSAPPALNLLGETELVQ